MLLEHLRVATHLDDVLGEDAVNVLGPVVDNGRDTVDVVQLHRVVQLGRVSPLLPRQGDVGQLYLELQGGLQLVANTPRISAE